MAIFSPFSVIFSQNRVRNLCLSGINSQDRPKVSKWLNLAIFDHFDTSGQKYAFCPWIRTKKCQKSRKIVIFDHFPDPRVTHPQRVWKFCVRIPIQATNFRVRGVWDDRKYRRYFRLSWPPVYPNRLAVLKTGPKTCTSRVVQKGSKSRQNDEVQRPFLSDFQRKSDKIAHFPAQRAKHRPGCQKLTIL